MRQKLSKKGPPSDELGPSFSQRYETFCFDAEGIKNQLNRFEVNDSISKQYEEGQCHPIKFLPASCRHHFFDLLASNGADL
jgi:hypothetical protein